MKSRHPRVTLAFLSWNRLHYLRATLLSARECIHYPNLEWIVSDNQSVEPGLREFIGQQDWLDYRLCRTQSHADAMNEIVGLASGDYLLIWPEDVQFVVAGDWLVDMVEILERHPECGSLCLDFQRRTTLQGLMRPRLRGNMGRLVDEVWRYALRFRRPRRLVSSRGARFFTFGWAKSGVCGSGIPSLTRTALWRELGPWRARGTREQINIIDSSLGAEDDMVQRFFASRRPLQGVAPYLPVAADILTDPLGCKAKVRGACRYGVYMPPPCPPYYYRIRPMEELKDRAQVAPLAFSQGVEPLGFTLPVDANGDRLKVSFNPSVQYDIANDRPIPYPLARFHLGPAGRVEKPLHR